MSGSEPALPAGEVDPDEISAASFAGHGLADDDPLDDDCSSDEGVLSLSPSLTASPGESKVVEDDSSALCIICFERPPETTLEPCGHANLCLTCLSRLAKRRCPTCRARAKKVRHVHHGELVTRPVRDIINERKRNEDEVLGSTLQIVFLGPPSVGKKTLVRKLVSRFPMHPPQSRSQPQGNVPDRDAADNTENDDTDESDPPLAPKGLHDEDIFSDGTDFSGNACIAGADVRLSVLRRTSLTSRRMMLDDVRVLKPDVVVLCCSAHTPATFDEMLAWDRVLRGAYQRCRVWTLLAIDEGDFSADASAMDLPSTISAITPDVRPRGHYLCTHGTAFNIGFRQLAKDVVSIARMARDEQFATELAAEEARHLAVQHAAGTLVGQSEAASLVIANNGIPLPHFAHMHVSAPHSSRTQTASGRPSESTRAPFGIRGMRARDSGNNSGGISFAGIVSWFSSGTSNDTQ